MQVIGPHADATRQWYPIPESLTIHPADRANLNEQLPTAKVYGQPIHGNTPIIEDPGMTRGTLRIRIQGSDITVTLGHGPKPRWERCNPYTGLPIGEPTFETGPAETSA
jgi:hypothetical protein